MTKGGSIDAVAETITNNVRSTIIKERLSDPAYYDRMSALLAEIIADLKAKRIEYAEYLKRIAELAKQVQTGQSDNTPEALNTPGLRALYHNLRQEGMRTADRVAEQSGLYPESTDPDVDLAQKIDRTVKTVRPDGWRGIQAREQVIKAALYNVLPDVDEVERIFLVIKAQSEY